MATGLRAWKTGAAAAVFGVAIWLALKPPAPEVDADHYPYAMTGVRPEFHYPGGVVHETTLLGEIPATYEQRELAAGSCRKAAEMWAEIHHVPTGWSYVCCTVAPDSGCKTKVR